MSDRIEYVDIAKGFGIILVVCSHSDALDLMWMMMGMFVPIFYFCSGFTYSRRGTYMMSLRKKFTKLIVPYLFFNVVMLIVFGHFSMRELIGIIYSRYSLYPLDVTPNLKFLTSGNYPMWFLTSMYITFVFFCIIMYYDRYKYIVILIYAFLTVVFMACPILLPWSIDTAPLTALIMYAGMETRRRGLMALKVWHILFLLSLYVSFQLVGGNINLSVRMYGNSVAIYFLLAICGSFIVLWCSRFLQGSLVGKIFVILGKHSLTIFCIEMAFIVWAKDIYKYLFPSYGVNYLTGIFEIVFALIGGLAVSVVIHKSRILSRIAYAS